VKSDGVAIHSRMALAMRSIASSYKGENPFDLVLFLVLGLIFYRYSRKVRIQDKQLDLFQVSRGGVPFSISSLSLTHVDKLHGLELVISSLLFAKYR
jgi:hypothetical protein